MDQARTTISKIFNGEPRSYTRFNLTQNMEGEHSHVEMKLSGDVDEEPGDAAPGNFLNHNHNHNRQVAFSKPQRSPRNVCFMAAGVLLLFIIGYLIGYLAHRKQGADLETCSSTAVMESQSDEGPLRMDEEPTLAWSDIKSLLQNRLSVEQFDHTFSEFALSSHEAGSDGDEALANRVMDRFTRYGMVPWTDEHFVKLQAPGSNQILFGDEVIGTPKGYAAYSATGSRQGRIVYAHYGVDADFLRLKDLSINVRGSVVLLRAGKLSFAEKVANAARQKAAAVLIYPDPADYRLRQDTELYGHVHMGSGDPYTPGFPSFNHTQFPPAQSSGLPPILAQTISATLAERLFKKMSGPAAPASWEEGQLQGVTYRLGGENDNVTVVVNNMLVETKIHNVFGVIKGFVDADRYVVVGAQRDSWGPGFAKATVGTSVMLELAHALSGMVTNGGFKPRRSIIFASWSAGEYGSIGATEWLEGYLTSLNMKAFTYVSLDGVVRGDEKFFASASPLLYSLLQETMKEVSSPMGTGGRTLYADIGGADFEREVIVPMKMDDTAYPFLSFSGIPSLSFCFAGSKGSDYPYFGTAEDTQQQLGISTSQRTSQLAVAASQVAGQMVLRLVHDHLLRLDVTRYVSRIRSLVSRINRLMWQQKQSGAIPKSLTAQWLNSASGSFSRASRDLAINIENSDLSDMEMCRKINDRLMRVEPNLLSPYVSPRDMPFRHILLGSGLHTLSSLVEQLTALGQGLPDSDLDRFRNELALTTWTIQGCSNALSGDLHDMDKPL